MSSSTILRPAVDRFPGDPISLVFCDGFAQPFEDERSRLILAGTTLEVTPGPFGGGEVRRAVPARRDAPIAD